MRAAALLYGLCAVLAACSLPAAHATAVPGEALSLTVENISKGNSCLHTRLLLQQTGPPPSHLSVRVLPSPDQNNGPMLLHSRLACCLHCTARSV